MATPDSAGFVEVHVIRHESGAAVVITQRTSEPHLHSFKLCKEFRDKAGAVQRTSYLNRRHLDALPSLLNLARAWLDAAQDRAQAPVNAVSSSRAG